MLALHTVVRTPFVLLSLLAMVGCAAGGDTRARGDGPAAASAAPRMSPEQAATLRAELLQRLERDQHWRGLDFEAMPPEQRQQAFREGARVDRENTARLKEIVAAHGWPTRELVGDEAAKAAFLLAQHADHDPEFQAHCLPLLEQAAARGEASKSAVAYLTDRVRVKQQRPQVHGTQYHVRQDASGAVVADAEGRLSYLLPIVEDVDRLDERRAAMGLPPWRDYERKMAADQGREPAPRPRAWDGTLPVDPQR